MFRVRRTYLSTVLYCHRDECHVKKSVVAISSLLSACHWTNTIFQPQDWSRHLWGKWRLCIHCVLCGFQSRMSFSCSCSSCEYFAGASHFSTAWLVMVGWQVNLAMNSKQGDSFLEDETAWLLALVDRLYLLVSIYSYLATPSTYRWGWGYVMMQEIKI